MARSTSSATTVGTVSARFSVAPKPYTGAALGVLLRTSSQPVQAAAAQARSLGFGAKLCIHPAQVAPVNAAFRPTAQEADWAQRIVEAAARSGGAAAIVDGKMIDRPVILRAQAILAAQ